MTALYNEFDPKAAEWTRNLITAGHVAPGVVDERSISDLVPADVAGVGQRHFFAGIAGWSLALRLAGTPDDADVWTGSCPCQGFSSAGKRRGFDDPRHLWPAWFGLIRECRPPVILGEQVASRLGWAWLDLVFADLEGAGYACAAADLPACSVGAPHRRQRLFFVAYANGQQGRLLAARREPGRADAQAKRGGEALNLAHASGQGLEIVGGEQSTRPERETVERGSSAVSVADSAGERRRGLSRDDGARREQPEFPGGGEASRVGNPNGVTGGRNVGVVPRTEAKAGRAVWSVGNGSRAAGSVDDRAMADAQGSGRSEGDDSGQAGEDGGRGLAHSGWSNCEWIPCSDGVSRPVEPGTHPLAHGVPGRVGLLRGYSNAINPEVAAAFIRAAMRAG